MSSLSQCLVEKNRLTIKTTKFHQKSSELRGKRSEDISQRLQQLCQDIKREITYGKVESNK